MKIEISESKQFIRASDVEDGDIVTLLDEGGIREADFGTGRVKQVFEILVEHKGEKKLWTMNKTTLKNLVQAFGDETSKWIGKKVKLTKVKVNVRGQLRDCIVGQPIKNSKNKKSEKKQSKRQSKVEVIKI